jgi:hypothetical protein
MNKLSHFNIRMLVMFILALLPLATLAQKFTISGYVRDADSGEELIGANIYIKELEKGTTSNHYGYYSITLQSGQYTLVSSYIGYKNLEKPIQLNKDLKINLNLKSANLSTEEVIIAGERKDKNVQSVEVGTISLPIKTIQALPVLFGETDILKIIQLLPGVQSASEGNAGFYVRGGGPDQNLILLDGANVYNASHLLGFFSVFNGDAIKDVKLIKGGMPADYGGRLSSVLDIAMKEGNMREYEVNGGIGLISSRLKVEGPIIMDTSSFLITGRRTYIDILTRPFVADTSVFAGSGYYFYDMNAKINYRLSDNDRLYLSGYYGKDVFTFSNQEDGISMSIPWGNATASLRWNHLFSDRLFANTTLIFSDYQFDIKLSQNNFDLRLFSGITNYTGAIDFSYFPGSNHKITFGTNYTRHTFIPSSISAQSEDIEVELGNALRQFANDYSIYFNDEFDVTRRLKLNLGVRGTLFQQVGPFTRYVRDEQGNAVDTIMYQPGEEVARYQHLEPRMSLRYILSKTSSLKASYTMNYQYIHLAAISSLILPTDLWIPSSDLVKPQKGVQYSLGYFKNFFADQFETSVEVYYKTMDNLLEYRPGSNFGTAVGDNADNNFVYGRGWSYGLELFIRRNYGDFTGFVGYTWAKTERQFDEINQGKVFPAKYDRRHDIAATFMYDLAKRWQVSAVFVYGTGSAFTPIVGRYFMQNGTIVTEYGPFNSYRMKPYHRMDISLTYSMKSNFFKENTLNFSVYNLYNRQNPYLVYFDFEGNITQGEFNAYAKQLTIFPIIPSISWNFSF